MSVALIRTCPLCKRRYSADVARCPGCGQGATSARVLRDGLDAERTSGARSGASEAVGIIVIVVASAIGALQGARVPVKYLLYLGVLGLIAAVWLVRRLRKTRRAAAPAAEPSAARQEGAAAAGGASRPRDRGRIR